MTPHTAATTTDQTPFPAAAALVISLTSNRNYVKANTSESSGPPYGPSIITGWSFLFPMGVSSIAGRLRYTFEDGPSLYDVVIPGRVYIRYQPSVCLLLIPSCFFFFSFVLLLLIDKASGLLYPSFFWLVARPAISY